MNVAEENLNVMLAELLAERGLKALGEVILRKEGRRPQPDVLLELNGIRIIIEGKKQKPGIWDELIKRCIERIDNGVCDLCVMLEYADIELEKQRKLIHDQVDIKNALLKGRFNVGFMSYIDRIGLDKWVSGLPKSDKYPERYERYENISFDELVVQIMSAYSKIVTEDIIDPVIRRINDVLYDFATSISSIINVERLRKVLELREEREESDE
jgi:hypothetical protein